MESIKGKTALITGAGKGLGKAIALALAEEGVNLALLSRTEKDLTELAGQLAESHPGVKVAYAAADVSDLQSVKAGIAKLKEEIGQIDILVNNAGIGKFGKFLELEVEEWEQIIQTNVLGAYYVIREILPQMLERQSGDIINISSTAANSPGAVTSAYSASKAALSAMSAALMQEVRKSNIRVSNYSPSTTASDMAIALNLTDGNPEKVQQPEDFAELVVAHLKLNRRTFVKEAGLWSTNP